MLKSGARVTIVREPDGTDRVAKIEQGFTFAFELRNAARVMVNHAETIDEAPNRHFELRAFVHGAIVLAYASLEAALNETIHLNALDPNGPLGEIDRKVLTVLGQENLQPRDKAHALKMFNMLLRILQKPEMPTGENPYQAANLVRVLRNMLIHPIPGRVVTYIDDEDFDYSSQQDIVKQLRSHLRLKRDATFPERVLTKKCASWAVESTEAFLHEFVVRSGIDPGFITER